MPWGDTAQRRRWRRAGDLCPGAAIAESGGGLTSRPRTACLTVERPAASLSRAHTDPPIVGAGAFVEMIGASNANDPLLCCGRRRVLFHDRHVCRICGDHYLSLDSVDAFRQGTRVHCDERRSDRRSGQRSKSTRVRRRPGPRERHPAVLTPARGNSPGIAARTGRRRCRHRLIAGATYPTRGRRAPGSAGPCGGRRR